MQRDRPEKALERLFRLGVKVDKDEALKHPVGQRREVELRQAERRPAEVEANFAKNLELLKRDVLNEEEFNRANVVRRDERMRLTPRQTELSDWLSKQHERQDAVGARPVRVRSFLKDFQSLDVRRAKALLQTILKTATVSKDGTIELEFR